MSDPGVAGQEEPTGAELLEREVARRRQAEEALRELGQKYTWAIRNLDKTSREIFAIRSIVNMPQLYVDDRLRIVGYSAEFMLLTTRIAELARDRVPIDEFFAEGDSARIRGHLQRIRELEGLPFDQGEPWELRYRGPGEGDRIGEDWIVYSREDRTHQHWSKVRRGDHYRFIHRAHLLDNRDCCLMTAAEYGGATEDLRLVYRVRTPARADEIQDLTAIISGTSGREAQLPDLTGYTICTGSNHNTLARIQKQGGDVVSHPEALEADTDYEVVIERTGGRIFRTLSNLATGERFHPVEFIDYYALYDQHNHVGFYTFCGGIEIFGIEIWTRPSRFGIERFRLPIDVEVSLREEALRERVFHLKYAKNDLLGQVLHSFFLEDVTRRRRDEEALRESEEKYRRLFEESSVARSTTTSGGRLLDVNGEFLKLLGLEREELERISADELWVDPQDRRRYLEVLVRQGFVRDYEVRFRKRDGTPMDCLITSTVHRDSAGGVFCIQGSIQDVTERKRIESQLKEAQRMEVIGRLASGVAHEVRNPLNAILAITEALFQELGDSPDYRPYLEHIRNQVDRLSTLMRDLLELGKPMQRNTFKPCSLREICTGALELWRQSSAHRARTVGLVSADGLDQGDALVLGNSSRLKQVVINLLENAAQHSPEGSEIMIAIGATPEGEAWVRVIDRGTGIAPEILPEVFRPFFTTRTRGSGLGLSIVKSIVETHGGCLQLVNNAPGSGLTVEVRLPLAEEDLS